MKVNVNDEYLCAVRTKSFADFFIQAQLLVNHSHPSINLLLNPPQETIASLLKSSPHLNSILSDYFNISAEASALCAALLQTLIHLQTNYRSINQIINSRHHEFLQLAVSGLLDNPFADLNGQNYFQKIHDKHSRVLKRLRKKMAGKLRMIEFLFSGMRRFGVFKRGSVTRRAADVAAKGAWILKRDFDTMGRLVARIGDEIEHSRAMMEVCLDRDCLEVLKECEFGVSRQAEELEEHVYLCLLTINRARAMVVREICRNSSLHY
ncbi:UPF0496 protein At3g49070-like [Salvia miltiorrhiza]|uniref:UPF0496 protein At3g49070-like n=1 Tax=Salvia miltiorrhiza TaxID=226208 RepID=UPI0025AC347E|nr:UPF0496 protein At3g49070-like [Salvia miltiorrhiza]